MTTIVHPFGMLVLGLKIVEIIILNVILYDVLGLNICSNIKKILYLIFINLTLYMYLYWELSLKKHSKLKKFHLNTIQNYFMILIMIKFTITYLKQNSRSI